MTNWQVIKWRKRDECLIFITNNVLLALQWHMKRSAYPVDDADVEDEMDEDK